MSRVKILITIPQGLLAELNQVVQENKRSRSDLVREAIRLYLQMYRAQRRPGESPQVQRAVAVQDLLAQKDSVPWDGVAEIRKWREAQ